LLRAETAKPTLADAKAMPREIYEYPNSVLLEMAAHGDPAASEERMRREIMFVHSCSWEEAEPHLNELKHESRRLFYLTKLPYRFGIVASISAAVASFPLCFHRGTTLWFNDKFVTGDVADAKDLETWLEVGSWSWNWMEPPLGQMSFVLLCLSFARSQMQNIGIRPYTDWWMERRALRLEQRFPQYSKAIVHDFARGDWVRGKNE